MTSKNQNPGNFANDREKARDAGKKGGQSSNSHSDRSAKTSDSGKRNGSS